MFKRLYLGVILAIIKGHSIIILYTIIGEIIFTPKFFGQVKLKLTSNKETRIFLPVKYIFALLLSYDTY